MKSVPPPALTPTKSKHTMKSSFPVKTCDKHSSSQNVMWDQLKNYNVPSILQADPTSPSVHPSIHPSIHNVHPNRFNMILKKRTHEVPQKNQLIVHNNTKFRKKPTWFTLTNAEFRVCFLVHFCEVRGLAIIHPEEE
jgi:hypothetical protein